MIRLGLFVITIGLLSGCSSEREMMIDKGYPIQYANGYGDGCNTGRTAAGGFGSLNKRIRLYDSNKDYRRGWDEGRSLCYEREKSMQAVNLQNAISSRLYRKKK